MEDQIQHNQFLAISVGLILIFGIAGSFPAVSAIDYTIDTDGDGLSDYVENNVYGTNPNEVDSDVDLFTDNEEILIYGTNPALSDTDGDGVIDSDEILIYGTNPVSDTDAGDVKTEICHIPPGNPSEARTITIGEPVVNKHLAHADVMGPCDEQIFSAAGGETKKTGEKVSLVAKEKGGEPPEEIPGQGPHDDKGFGGFGAIGIPENIFDVEKLSTLNISEPKTISVHNGIAAEGKFLSAINSANVCGDSLCDEPMSVEEKLQMYLASRGLTVPER